ncbi:fibronectin type III domain-containing protein [Paenibacillus qinlingensis]|uniref:Fibronectin type-III domain-containing protein n=1 Tax=Paenibacillus qinlingensis TaxID=1837343 RepID=A0ABU1P2E8_9BACL|nr:hypothetical protein [Paenibacillus qinlingensis]MDR6553898.1 hypothetical protein [Paenibacillus qinlingensis]
MDDRVFSLQMMSFTWRKQFRWVIGVFCAMVVFIAGVATAHAANSFGPSGYDGGGFHNVIAVDPFGSGLVLAGADAGGIQRSTDSGSTWSPSNAGLTNKSHLVIASIVFSKVTPNKVYIGVGKSGSLPEGALYVSTDGGQNWSLRGGSSSPMFAGGNNKDIGSLPVPHPRSTGTLIALDETTGAQYVYAGTFDQGVKRSNDDGLTWTTIGLSGKYIRSVALDPANVNTLYAAVYGEGVYKSTNAKSTTPTWSLVASGDSNPTPQRIEELKFIGGTLYAVGTNNAGTAATFYKLISGAWVQRWSAAGEAVYHAIDGYRASTEDVIYIGAVWEPSQDTVDTTMYQSVLKSTDSGLTFTPVTTTSGNIDYHVGGAGGSTWWLSQHSSEVMTMLGTKRSKVSGLAIDPSHTNVIYTAGVQGVWKSDNGGVNWYPYSRNLNVTFNRAIAADPNGSGRVYSTDADWTFVYSADRMSHVNMNKAAVDNGLAIALDTATSPSVVYTSIGDQQTNADGEIYSNPDPTNSSNVWTAQGLLAQTGGKRPLAIAVNRVSGAPVIIAAVQEGGIWRKASGTWTQVASPSSVMGAQTTKTATLTWVNGSSLVYLYDRHTGVWRSNDSGVTWTKIWAKTATTVEDMRGFVAADPSLPSRIYVSAYDGLYRLDNANTGSVEGGQISKTTLSVTDPAAITLDASGGLYVTSITGGSGAGRLYKSTNQGTTLTEISDTYYRANGGFPLDISVAPDGYIYVATFGQGIVVGKVIDTTAPSTPASLSATAVSTSQINLTWTASTDNVGVAGYKVYRNGTEVGTTINTSYSDMGLAAGTTYTYTVKAFDPTGNLSSASNTASATTSSLTILLSDDFEDGNANGWSVNGGTWSVVTDSSTKAYYNSDSSATSRSYAGTSTWANYSVSAKVKVSAWDSTNSKVGLMARYIDNSNSYILFYNKANNNVIIRKRVSGVNTTLDSALVSALSTGVYHTFTLEVNGSTINAYLNGALVASGTDSSLTSGYPGLYVEFQKTYFNDVVVSQ